MMAWYVRREVNTSEYFPAQRVESNVKGKNSERNRPEAGSGRQFSFGAKRSVQRRVGRMFTAQKCWISPLFDSSPDATRALLRVVSKYT
jgi:hypothetical protein